VTRPDWSALGAGIAVLALGALLFVESNDTVDLTPVWLLSALGACLALALVAAAAGRRAQGPTRPRREATGLSWAGLVLGLALGAGLLFAWANGSLEAAGSVALAALAVTIALSLISAPFWLAMFRRLGAERVARARSEERAELGAHLHDSVLQTLALMQKHAAEPEEVARLARHQERELRSWLAGGRAPRPTERLADALRAAAIEVEESHGAPVEAIVVGDAPLDEGTGALVAASREALTNAVKFASDGGPVRLYAEIEGGTARVFIDDRGPGFDPEAIPDDRRGLRESIIGRMERHGGHAEIRSEPGEGTEVELTLGRGRR
jgi:signal transduction histidine kinase